LAKGRDAVQKDDWARLQDLRIAENRVYPGRAVAAAWVGRGAGHRRCRVRDRGCRSAKVRDCRLAAARALEHQDEPQAHHSDVQTHPAPQRAARRKAADVDRAARELRDALQAHWDATERNFLADPQAERDELV
jgi:hypothetical protein